VFPTPIISSVGDTVKQYSVKAEWKSASMKEHQEMQGPVEDTECLAFKGLLNRLYDELEKNELPKPNRSLTSGSTAG
jgi:hypothetical protein